jgi:hypothetical protein
MAFAARRFEREELELAVDHIEEFLRMMVQVRADVVARRYEYLEARRGS